MQVAILHYHLNSGGVARVVQNHLLALAQVPSRAAVERVLLLHGGRPLGWEQHELENQLSIAVESVVVEGLDYDKPGSPATEQLLNSIDASLRNIGCTPEDTILHWHNHALGKNVSAPLAVRRLASLGFRTLLQIHDFAEDFRPDNYERLVSGLTDDDVAALPAQLYPQAEHIFYATLNRRDYQILSTAGIANDRLCVLPNPVSPPPAVTNPQKARQEVGEVVNLAASERLATYPVRGIRRKNLGEMLLWSAAAQDTRFLVTLAPKNPAERASFDRWQDLARELNLACQFGMPTSAGVSFEQVQAASDVLISTSVAEGFGMSFLESWLANQRLLGRNLPEITSDFGRVGLKLSEMYGELLIPTDWVNSDQFLDQMSTVVNLTYQSFGVVPPSPAALQQQLSSFLEPVTIDFARLPTKGQVDVVRKVYANDSDRERLHELNPKLVFTDQEEEKKLILANAGVVREHFSLAAIGEQLVNLYEKIMNSNPSSELPALIDSQAILESFLRVDRLHPVRVEP